MNIDLANDQKLQEYMTLKRGTLKPLAVFLINGTYIVGVYKGQISEFDILIKYRQFANEKWSNPRTPKHIHWAVDMLIKLHENPEHTKQFLNTLISIWNTTEPLKSEHQRSNVLDIDYLLNVNKDEIEKIKDKLKNKGEYSINFLIILARLLMLQEKTNRNDAYMFKNLLDALYSGRDIFKIVSIASHTGRKK